MAKGYHHLTHDLRCQIYALKATGLRQVTIARILQITPATLSRELKRNTGKRGYRYKQAHILATARRHRASSRPRRMTPALIDSIEDKLRDKWSPVQISGELKLDGILISPERIYQHVWHDKNSMEYCIKTCVMRAKNILNAPREKRDVGSYLIVSTSRTDPLLSNKNRALAIGKATSLSA